MSSEDIVSLIAYLKVVGHQREAGITDTTIDIGIARSGADARAGEVEAVVAAYFDDVNRSGGIYNRSLKLHPLADGSSGPIDDQQFALLSGNSDEGDAAMLAAAGVAGVPAIGTRTGFAAKNTDADRHRFFLFPEVASEASALALYAREHRAQANAAGVILYPNDARWSAPVNDAVATSRADGWSGLRPVVLPDDADMAKLVEEWRGGDVEIVIALGPSSAANALLHEIEKGAWRPTLYMPGELGENEPLDIPAGLDDRVYLSYPTWLQSMSPDGMDRYTQLRERYHLRTHYLRDQLAALAEAMILVEGLKRAGHDITREKLVAELERFYQFETGLIPPVTYGPNRRTGTDDLYIVSLGAGAKSSSLVARYVASRTGGNQ